MHEFDDGYWLNPETGKIETSPIHWIPVVVAGAIYMALAIAVLMFGNAA